ncbi:MAG: phage antirepressor KilAC domain-containing protein [Ruminococcus sp.]|nr:phage antirepressor KilAC domain-containing protein [Ruminococcus sp.]
MTRDGFTLLAMGFTGKEAMQWKLKYIEAFNNLEKLWNSPEMIMKRALDIANSRVKALQLSVSELTVANEIMRPKADYFDELVDRRLLTNIRDTAKELHIKQNAFVKFLLDKKYMYRDKKGKLQPYSSALDDDLFEVKEFVNDKTGFSSTQTLITPKGRETFRLLMIA